MSIRWNPSIFCTGIEKLDIQHKTMIVTLNDVYNMLKKNSARKDILNTFGFFIDYSIEHFAYEEELMEQHNYPDLYLHKYEHEKFMDNISIINNKFDTNEKPKKIAELIYHNIYHWLATHISTLDKDTANFIINKT